MLYNVMPRTLGTDFWLLLETHHGGAGWGRGNGQAAHIRTSLIRMIDEYYPTFHDLRLAIDDLTEWNILESRINAAWNNGHRWPLDRDTLASTFREHMVAPTEDPRPGLVALNTAPEAWASFMEWANLPGLPLDALQGNPVDALQAWLIDNADEVTAQWPLVLRASARSSKAFVSLLASMRARAAHALKADTEVSLVAPLFMHLYRENPSNQSVFFDGPTPDRGVLVRDGLDGSGDVLVRCGRTEQYVSALCLRPLKVEPVEEPVEAPGMSERIAGLEAALRQARADHERDVETIARVFWKEAHEREWCREAEAVIREINRDLTLHFPDDRDAYAPSRDWDVSGRAEVSFTDSLGETWTCSDFDFTVTVTVQGDSDAATEYVEDEDNWDEVLEAIKSRATMDPALVDSFDVQSVNGINARLSDY